MQKTVITKIDDLTGKEYDEGETITFVVQGEAFEIDLNNRNAAQFKRSLAKYMEKGRKVRAERPVGRTHRQGDGRKVKHDREYVRAVRAWAQENGYSVSDRGRVPLSVYDAYEKANG
jgi:hypothetical protein